MEFISASYNITRSLATFVNPPQSTYPYGKEISSVGFQFRALIQANYAYICSHKPPTTRPPGFRLLLYQDGKPSCCAEQGSRYA